MADDRDAIKSEMIERINSGGAWFCTRPDNYLRIGLSPSDNLIYARECVLGEGTITGGAYMFGTDWFDISFHGRWVDIYVDPDSLRYWELVYDEKSGTYRPADASALPERLAAFCRQAEQEAADGITGAFHIDGTGFTHDLVPSEERMGRKEDILAKVGLR